MQQRRLSFGPPSNDADDNTSTSGSLLFPFCSAESEASSETAKQLDKHSDVAMSEGSIDSLVSAADISPREPPSGRSRRKHKHDKKTSFKSPPPLNPKHRKWQAKREALLTAELAEAVAEAVATRVAESLPFSRIKELLSSIRDESSQQLTDLTNSFHCLLNCLKPDGSSRCSQHSSQHGSYCSASKDPERHLTRHHSKSKEWGTASMGSLSLAAPCEEKSWQVCGVGAAACAKKIQAEPHLEPSKLQAATTENFPTLLPRTLGMQCPGHQPAHLSSSVYPYANVCTHRVSTPPTLQPHSEHTSRCPSPYQSEPGFPSCGLERVEEMTRSITTGNLPGELEDLIMAARRQSSDSLSSEADSLSSRESFVNAEHERGPECPCPQAQAPRSTTLPDRLRDLTFSAARKKPGNSYNLTSGCQMLGSRGPRLLRRSLMECQSPGSVFSVPSRTPTFESLYEVQRQQEKMLLLTDMKTQERRSSGGSGRLDHLDRRSAGRPEHVRRSSYGPDLERNDKLRGEVPDLEVVTEVISMSTAVVPDQAGPRAQHRHTTGQSHTTSTPSGELTLSECPSFSLEALRRQRNTELSKIAFANEALSDRDTMSSEEEDQLGTVKSSLQLQQAQRRLRLILKLTLRLWGVVPWYPDCSISSCYQMTAVLAVTLIAVFPAVRLALSDSGPEEELSAQMLVCIVPFALAGMVGLASMQNQLAKELLWCYPGQLETYAAQHGFMEQWSACSLRRFILVFIVWASAVLLCALNWGLSEAGMLCERRFDLMYFICFFFGSGVFAALIFCQIYIFGMLEIMVDQFCIKFFEDPEVGRGLMEWNLVQAILRRVATALDTTFLATQAMAQVTFVVSATYTVMADRLHDASEKFDYSQDCHIGHHGLALLPSVLLAFGAWTLFFFGAAVTEKCSRVPAMINTMTFDDCQRQSMVQYVVNSAAGLYIKEVRLTASVVMKLTYVTGLWVLAVLTEFIGK